MGKKPVQTLRGPATFFSRKSELFSQGSEVTGTPESKGIEALAKEKPPVAAGRKKKEVEVIKTQKKLAVVVGRSRRRRGAKGEGLAQRLEPEDGTSSSIEKESLLADETVSELSGEIAESEEIEKTRERPQRKKNRAGSQSVDLEALGFEELCRIFDQRKKSLLEFLDDQNLYDEKKTSSKNANVVPRLSEESALLTSIAKAGINKREQMEVDTPTKTRKRSRELLRADGEGKGVNFREGDSDAIMVNWPSDFFEVVGYFGTQLFVDFFAKIRVQFTRNCLVPLCRLRLDRCEQHPKPKSKKVVDVFNDEDERMRDSDEMEGVENLFGPTILSLAMEVADLTVKRGGTTTISNLYKLRSICSEFDFDEESSNQLSASLLKMVSNPLVYKNDEGRKLLSFVMSGLHAGLTRMGIQAINEVVACVALSRSHQKNLESTPSSTLESMSKIVYSAWRDSDLDCREIWEQQIDIWVNKAVVMVPSTASCYCELLAEFQSLSNRANQCVSDLILKYYPLAITNRLNVPNPKVRCNAIRMFCLAFPLVEASLPTREYQTKFEENCAILKSLSADPDIECRRTAVKGVCGVCGQFWQIIPPAITIELLSILINSSAKDISAEVRSAVAAGLLSILQSLTPRGVLLEILPDFLPRLLFDVSGTVRNQAARVLVKASEIKEFDLPRACGGDIGVLLAQIVRDSALQRFAAASLGRCELRAFELPSLLSVHIFRNAIFGGDQESVPDQIDKILMHAKANPQAVITIIAEACAAADLTFASGGLSSAAKGGARVLVNRAKLAIGLIQNSVRRFERGMKLPRYELNPMSAGESDGDRDGEAGCDAFEVLALACVSCAAGLVLLQSIKVAKQPSLNNGRAEEIKPRTKRGALKNASEKRGDNRAEEVKPRTKRGASKNESLNVEVQDVVAKLNEFFVASLLKEDCPAVLVIKSQMRDRVQGESGRTQAGKDLFRRIFVNKLQEALLCVCDDERVWTRSMKTDNIAIGKAAESESLKSMKFGTGQTVGTLTGILESMSFRTTEIPQLVACGGLETEVKMAVRIIQSAFDAISEFLNRQKRFPPHDEELREMGDWRGGGDSGSSSVDIFERYSPQALKPGKSNKKRPGKASTHSSLSRDNVGFLQEFLPEFSRAAFFLGAVCQHPSSRSKLIGGSKSLAELRERIPEGILNSVEFDLTEPETSRQAMSPIVLELAIKLMFSGGDLSPKPMQVFVSTLCVVVKRLSGNPSQSSNLFPKSLTPTSQLSCLCSEGFPFFTDVPQGGLRPNAATQIRTNTQNSNSRSSPVFALPPCSGDLVFHQVFEKVESALSLSIHACPNFVFRESQFVCQQIITSDFDSSLLEIDDLVLFFYHWVFDLCLASFPGPHICPPYINALTSFWRCINSLWVAKVPAALKHSDGLFLLSMLWIVLACVCTRGARSSAAVQEDANDATPEECPQQPDASSKENSNSAEKSLQTKTRGKKNSGDDDVNHQRSEACIPAISQKEIRAICNVLDRHVGTMLSRLRSLGSTAMDQRLDNFMCWLGGNASASGLNSESNFAIERLCEMLSRAQRNWIQARLGATKAKSRPTDSAHDTLGEREWGEGESVAVQGS